MRMVPAESDPIMFDVVLESAVIVVVVVVLVFDESLVEVVPVLLSLQATNAALTARTVKNFFMLCYDLIMRAKVKA